jgi:hypothetical protein
MVSRKPGQPSPTSLARAERQREAAEEGARAMADVDRNAVTVRTNMARLRALRQAKEAEDAIAQAALPPAAKKKRKAPAKRKVSPAGAS